MPIKVLGDLKALGKKKPYVVPTGLLAKADAGETLVHVQKKPKKAKAATKEQVAPPAPEPVAPPVQVKTSANPATGKAELTITLPLVQETPAYLGVTHEGKTIWLAKASLVRFSLSGGSARFTMTRQQASRRGLLGKVESTAQAA